ncbi:unnamed protein product [Bursaphelenchus okinawaensis]|uniref:AMP-dependent synthetase/ligase domain-containing protein n=1 Tax=Bursaphelenchus okinawaensis TaxID=465554 RepID=A0A811JVH6_9BILA|nr:unnamed protein product [Bursaphelenchus okinawaensis]CAG9084301.1 unnamed protein product [Bursaphelenchus okinawaensis]
MPLQIRDESVFCLDFTHQRQKNFSPFEITIPELVYKKGTNSQTAFIFDSERMSFSFEMIKMEMEYLATGFVATGLKNMDRILICGHNHSQVLLSALAASRAGLVFSLVGANSIAKPEQLEHLLRTGEFRAVILFSSPNGGGSDAMYDLVESLCPEIKKCVRSKLKSARLPKLTHVILGDEDHKHAGTWTLSEIYGKCTPPRMEKLPNYLQWNSHRLACIQFTLGSTGPPKAAGLSHYQLINGCRIASNIIGIRKGSIMACALPLYRIPVFGLVAFTPFMFESRTIISEPSPVPRMLISSILMHRCTHLVSNSIAIRLLLKMAMAQKVTVPSVETVILLGDRVGRELLASLEKIMKNAKRIAVGMLLTEIGTAPVISDNTTNLIKSIGKALQGYQVDIKPIPKLQSSNGHTIGELRVKPLEKTKFMGYGPDFNANLDWIDTGDIASITKDGNVEILANKSDLIYDRMDHLVEHWKMEKLMAEEYDDIKGVQVVQTCSGAPVVAIIVPKKLDEIPQFFMSELISLCRNNKLYAPDKFAIVDDFPRVNTRIQKFKLREMLKNNLLRTY